jgi:hypothetical protein
MHEKIRNISYLAIFSIIIATAPVSAVAAENPDDWGIHKIWGKKNLDSLPAIRGSYIYAEWRDLNPSPGVYDFSIFKSELARYNSLGKRVTVSLRGRFKPDYLFKEVPYHREQFTGGVGDAKGSLAYWHPQYKKRYKELLQAFSKFLNASPHKSTVYSIRQNTNALGTEHSGIPDAKRSAGQWVVPAGVSFTPYSDAQNSSYKNFVSQTYYDVLRPDFFVLVRSVLLTGSQPAVPAVVMRGIENGTIGLLHTSSLPDAVNGSTERKYQVHLKYGKNGKTRIYAEPYDDSLRGPQPRPQWNYWRLLSDLHAGVSFISVYGADLNENSNQEFAAAFEFTNRYAGYQTGNSVTASPGAWAAVREGSNFLKGDYTFLMTRMSGDANVALESVGPDWQRFGAWARRVPANGRMRFQLDDRFANTLGGNATIRVTYFNSKSPRFSVVTNGMNRDVAGGGTGTWKTAEFSVPASDLKGNSGADITLQAKTDVTIHMVEVVRGGSSAPPPRASQAAPRAPTSLVVN